MHLCECYYSGTRPQLAIRHSLRRLGSVRYARRRRAGASDRHFVHSHLRCPLRLPMRESSVVSVHVREPDMFKARKSGGRSRARPHLRPREEGAARLPSPKSCLTVDVPEKNREGAAHEKGAQRKKDSGFGTCARCACLCSRPLSGDSSIAGSAPRARRSSCAGESGAKLPMKKASLQGVQCRAQWCVAFRARGSRRRVHGWCLHACACQAVV